MKERSCVFKFIERSQRSFSDGYSLHDVKSTVPGYKKFVKKAYGPMKGRLAHNVATSTFALNSFVVYEYLRHKGMPLPDANNIIKLILPVTRESAGVIHGDEKMAIQNFDEASISGMTDIFPEES